jgi:hypothetical protein
LAVEGQLEALVVACIGVEPRPVLRATVPT